MTFGSLIAVSLLSSATSQGMTTLERVFAKGEVSRYEVKSGIIAESRQQGLETWFPEEYDIDYVFSYTVTEMKADGIAVLRYKRPTITETEGETMDKGPVKRTEKLNLDFELTVSPVNDLLNMKDLNPPKPEKPAPESILTDKRLLKAVLAKNYSKNQGLQMFLSQFIQEIHRLALFLGSLDSSLDFSPKLPFDEVSVGEKWKRTVGYSPQKNKSGKMAVQRIDYTYVYSGIVEVNNVKYHRITAESDLKTDLAEFIHQTFNVKSDLTGLKEIPMTFKSKINFDLDLKTRKTIRASGTTEGGFRIVLTQDPGQAIEEERFKGKASLRLLPPAKA